MLLRKSYIILIMLTLTLSACKHTRTAETAQYISVREMFFAQQTEPAAGQERPHYSQNTGWWTLYRDDELNALMDVAFQNNPNINQIRARLEQAQALSKQSRSTRLPTLDIGAERNTSNGDNETPSAYAVSAAAGFEIDFWGKNKATTTSRLFEEKATREDLHTAMISLSASITETWLDVLSLLAQERLLRKQIDVNKTVLDLQQQRFEMGSSSALDILQQEEILARSQAELPAILSAQKQAANTLSLLTGKTRDQELSITEKPFPKALDIPQAGLPSGLLDNRPDIVAAWHRVRSAEWAAQSAWANRLPRFDLSAAYTTTPTKLSGLFETWLLNMAANIAAPVFDGGNREAEQIRQEAVADERFHAYREAVLTAITEVENSLISNNYQDKTLAALHRQLDASRKTLEQAQISYANGRSSYINVLNSLNNTQGLELLIVQEQLQQAKHRVSLYRALGGRSWAQNLPIEPYRDSHEEHHERHMNGRS